MSDRASWSYEAKGSKGVVVAFHLIKEDGLDKKGWMKWKGVCGHTAARWVSGDPSVLNDWDRVCTDCLESSEPAAEIARARKVAYENGEDKPEIPEEKALPPGLVRKTTLAKATKKGKDRLPEVLSTGTELLPVKLTETELLDLGQQLAQVESEYKAHEEHATSVKAGLKHREAELDAQRAEVASKIRAKTEARQVEVETTADYKRGIATTVRLDTMAKVRDRQLTKDERQGLLFNDEAA